MNPCPLNPTQVQAGFADLDTARLLPAAYQRYAAAVREGLACFVSHLPPARQHAWVVARDHRPLACDPAVQLVRLMRLCPTLHKLGQLLARDRRLDPRFRRALRFLETLPPATPMPALRQRIGEELGSLQDLKITLEDRPLAEASVAVVLPFTWDGGAGVFKLLKPGIETQLQEDLEAWAGVSAFLDQHRDRLDIADLDYRATFTQVRDALTSELEPTVEQQALRSAAAVYHGDRGVAVPALLPFCTPRITAMERLFGRRIDDLTAGKSALAEQVVRTLIAGPLLSTAPRALFHADPHAGNLLVADDGRLGLLDWAPVGHLSIAHREAVVQMVLAGWTLDARRLWAAIEAAALGVGDPAALQQACRRAIGRVVRGARPGVDWLVHLLDGCVGTAAVRFDRDLLLFRKVLLLVEGVVGDLAPQCSPDAVLQAAGWRQWCLDAVRRPFHDPLSRAFGTHLSGRDLLELSWNLPAVGLRWWQALLGSPRRPPDAAREPSSPASSKCDRRTLECVNRP